MKRSKVYLTRRQSRLVDEIAIREGITGITLMENAGKACVSRLTDNGVKSAVVCCGVGNNGGDGFVIARRLAIVGVPVKILVCGDVQRMSGDALTNYKIAENLDLSITRLDDTWNDQRLNQFLKQVNGEPTDWIVDCLLGTGASGDPRPPLDRVISACNITNARKMAVDVPSGLDCDTGTVGDPTFKADLTCTFVAKKTGFTNRLAAEMLGEIQVVSIGIPIEILERVVESEK